MAFLTVGGVTIPVAPGGGRTDWLDNVDRRRALDGSYRASATGNAKRNWQFSTPPVSRTVFGLYKSVLSAVTGQVCSGDVLEGSRNLILHSEEFDDAVWTKSNSTITLVDSLVAPNGTSTADLIYPTTTGALRSAYQTAATAAGVHTASIFSEPSDFNWLYLAKPDGSAVGAWFDLLNVRVGTVLGGYTATITPVGGTWSRVTLTGPVAGATAYLQAGLSDADNTTTATTSGTHGIPIWGAQLEPGPAATLYTKTTTAAVNTLALTCCTELTGWAPVKAAGDFKYVLDFQLHEV